MAASGNGKYQYSIRKRYTENLESSEIWKKSEGHFLKSKTENTEAVIQRCSVKKVIKG